MSRDHCQRLQSHTVARLLLQHNLIKSAFNGRLLFAPHSNDGNYEVLDCATGSGESNVLSPAQVQFRMHHLLISCLASWMMDLCNELSSSTKIHGVDIESSRFPTSYPDNISFSIHSVLSLPDGWSGRFDFVNQRLLGGGLKRDEFPAAIGEIYRVLKPGGWAQICEYGLWGFSLGPATDTLFTLYNRLFVRNGLTIRIFADIPDMMREAGFRNVHVERRGYPIGGEQGRVGRMCALEHYRSLKSQMVKHGLVESDEEISGIIDAMEKEWEQVDRAEAELVYAWAQKQIA